MEKLPIFVGQAVGLWRVIDTAPSQGYRKFWLCQCACGETRAVWHENLSRQKSTSCGCTKRTHGHTLKGIRSPTMRCYSSMVARCTRPSNPAFSHYQKRGIGICQRWLSGENGKTGFECFLDDMGVRPSAEHTIERINNDAGYSPENCVWATKPEQAKNRKTTTLYEFRGQRLHLREIAEATGLTYDCLRWRISRCGMSLDEAVSLPVQKGQRFSRDIPLRMLEYQGRMMTVREIAEASGVNYNSLRSRLASGESLEKALR